MHSIYNDFLNRLESLHENIKTSINDLPAEALDWSPGSDMNSLNILVTHIAGSQRYWIGDMIARETSNRDRAAEFRASAADLATLNEGLDNVMKYTRSVFESLNPSDLETMRPMRGDEPEKSVAWLLAGVISHTANHLGHMQVIHQLWEQKNGKQ